MDTIHINKQNKMKNENPMDIIPHDKRQNAFF